jgi:alkylation response protein AidB-like acyl-CoA dehydrogenase
VFSLRTELGLGLVQAAVVFEELGRALVPGPLVATHLAAASVEGAASGTRVVGLLEDGLLEYPEALDAAITADGRVLDVPDVTPVDAPLDPLTPMGFLAGGTSRVEPRPDGVVLTAALLVGVAAATTDLAVGYAKEREQFGRPIGSFQAVKHICADMFVRAEVARCAVHAAAVGVDDGAADESRAAPGAKLLASENAVANGKACIQVHGGMGFTWEVPAHLYLKRAAVLSTRFGGPDAHAEAVARTL